MAGQSEEGLLRGLDGGDKLRREGGNSRWRVGWRGGPKAVGFDSGAARLSGTGGGREN
jgi:hypothetical protein